MKNIAISILFLFSNSFSAQIIPVLPAKKEVKSVIITAQKIKFKPKVNIYSPKIKEQNTLMPEMVFVEGGSFNMGSDAGLLHEKPIHKITLNSFYIGKYEITVGQYRAYCKDTGRTLPGLPDWAKNNNFPISRVNHYDAIAYCKWLSDKTGNYYRLPTEAEWEFAAKGGLNTNNYIYSGSNISKEVAWYEGEPVKNRKIQVVGRKLPNELGIYDMSGNMWEWCNDWYDANYYAISPVLNPIGASKGTSRVLRGGSWNYEATYCRVTDRMSLAPDDLNLIYGFRVVSTL